MLGEVHHLHEHHAGKDFVSEPHLRLLAVPIERAENHLAVARRPDREAGEIGPMPVAVPHLAFLAELGDAPLRRLPFVQQCQARSASAA